VQECILRKVIRQHEVTRELAQEIPDLGLMAPDKFAESG
jgi:hypothetical protein